MLTMTVIIQDTKVTCTRSDNRVTCIHFYKIYYRQITIMVRKQNTWITDQTSLYCILSENHR